MITHRLLLITCALVNVSAFRYQDQEKHNRREEYLRGTPPSKRFHPLEHAIEKVHEAHPLQNAIEAGKDVIEKIHEEHPFEDIVEAGKDALEKVHERVSAIRSKVQAARKDFVEKLSAYEEGQLHFSWDCAKQNSLGKDACLGSSDGSCSWCEYNGVVSFCISSEDEDQFTAWSSDLACQSSNVEKEEIHTLLTNTHEESMEVVVEPVEEVVVEPIEDIEEVDSVDDVEEAKATLDFSFSCAASRSSDSCKEAKDESENSCAWCSVNSWIGVCVSPDDEDNAEALAMDCGSALM